MRKASPGRATDLPRVPQRVVKELELRPHAGSQVCTCFRKRWGTARLRGTPLDLVVFGGWFLLTVLKDLIKASFSSVFGVFLRRVLHKKRRLSRLELEKTKSTSRCPWPCNWTLGAQERPMSFVDMNFVLLRWPATPASTFLSSAGAPRLLFPVDTAWWLHLALGVGCWRPTRAAACLPTSCRTLQVHFWN